MAGLTAALTAAEAGADVLVLESEGTVGGSMAISGGLVWAPATFELARRWIPRGDARLQQLFVDGIEDAWSWFETHDVPLEPAVPCLKDRMGLGRLMSVGPRARGMRGPTSWPAQRAAKARRSAPGPRRPRHTWSRGLDGRVDRRGVDVVGDGPGPGLLWRGIPELDRPRTPLREPVARGDGDPQQPGQRRHRAAQPRPARGAGESRHALLLRAHPALHRGQGLGRRPRVPRRLLVLQRLLPDRQPARAALHRRVGGMHRRAQRRARLPAAARALLRRLRRTYPARAHRRRPDGHTRDRGDAGPREARPAARPGRHGRDRGHPRSVAAEMEAQFGVPAANMADTLRTYNGTTDPSAS